ncbi:MAG: hypothetical protein QXX03_05575 [Nitrososphaerota archaeon]
MIIAVDPSYRKIGMFIEGKGFYLIRNNLKTSDEDLWLYKLSHILRGHVIDKDKFLVLEYTNVPYIKPMAQINRVIGVIISSLGPLSGYWEISMNDVYRHFKIKPRSKNKKKLLREKISKYFPEFFVLEFNIIYSEIGKTMIRVDGKKLPIDAVEQDCIDAYALFLYAQKFKVKKGG